MGVNYNPGIYTNGLVMCIDAANKKSYTGSGTSVIDLTNNNQNIYLANNTQFSSNTSNGSGSFIFIGNNSIACSNGNTMPVVTSGSTVTQETLIYFSATSGGQQTIFCRGVSGIQFNYGMVINANLNQLCFRNSNNDWVIQSDSLTPGNWYHLVISTTPSGSTGYVNGVVKNTITNTTTSLNTSNNYWTMGCRPIPGPVVYENFFGNIAFYRVYHGIAFNQDQVSQNFNACRSRVGL